MTRSDVSVSGLLLNFIAFDRALTEQHRVVRPGGTIAAYVWDYAGEYEFARRFWDAALSDAFPVWRRKLNCPAI
jgi:hypothetical protein